MQPIRYILFDLGGVLLNIDYQLTINAFKDLGIENFDEIYSQSKQDGLFDAFEKGEIGEIEFVNELIERSTISIEAKHIRDAWDAMLLDFPEERLKLLKDLKNEFGVYLLSNTNAIHYTAFNQIFENSFSEPFTDQFHKDYYSHLMGKRKPDAEIFEQILEENSMNPDELLFIDDSEQHVLGARNLGINAQWMSPGKDVFDVLRESGVLA